MNHNEGLGSVILIAIGSNLPHPEHGQPRAVCEAALLRLGELGVPLLRRSRWFGTAPVPRSDQPWFVNGVAAVEPEPALAPADLLAVLHQVEAKFGRERRLRNEARILDLDLIDYRGMVSPPDSDLRLPHPRLQERAFVVLPLQDVSPNWRHPVSGEAIADIAARLPEEQQTEPLE